MTSHAEFLDEVAPPPPLVGRTGVGITPVLCSGKEWGPLQAGVDQVEVAVQLTPAGRQFVESRLTLKPARYGRFLCGMERNGVWSKFLGVSTLCDPKHGTIAYDFHPHGLGEFARLDGWVKVVAGELNRRAALGLEFEGWAIVKRADVGIDAGFTNQEMGRAFYEALRDRRYPKGRRVQERQPGWFSIYGRGTRQPVQHGRVYDKGVQSRQVDPWLWIRTERVVRWERRVAMRLSLLTPGALRHAYDEVFVDGLARGIVVSGDSVIPRLVSSVADGHITLRQYEQLAGYLLAERGGLVGALYRGRPDQLSRRERLARELAVVRDGAHAVGVIGIDLHDVMAECRATFR